MLLIVIRTMVQDFTVKEHVICVSMIIVIMIVSFLVFLVSTYWYVVCCLFVLME